MENDVGRWRDGASAELQAAVDAAVRQLEADEDYEAARPKVTDTLKSLDELATVARQMAMVLNRLSPVGRSAIYEASRLTRVEIQFDDRTIGLMPDLSRGYLDHTTKLAVNIACCSDTTKDVLAERHMSAGPVEQGARSNRGKESDLSAISYADRFMGVPFRQSKDKFAVRVIEALIAAGHPAGARNRPNSRSRLEALLNSIWLATGRQPTPSWTRVIKSLRRIAEKVQEDIDQREQAASRRARWHSAPPD